MRIRTSKWGRRAAAVMAIALWAGECSAQEALPAKNSLTNRDVVTLATAGFGDDFIIETIASSHTAFDTTAQGMADLAKQGIKEDIIRAMRNAHPLSTPSLPEPAFPSEVTNSFRPQPLRVFVDAGSGATMLAQSQTIEMVKTFDRKCPALVVTSRRESARFVVVMEREAGKLLRRGTSRMMVYDRAGDVVYAASERSPDKAVRGLCAMTPKLREVDAAGRSSDGRQAAR